MIPKIIHYCWFGSNELPEPFRTFIEDWKTMHPRWQIKCWNEQNSPMDEPYLQSALAHQCYSNASNYVRIHALAEEGGIYLDTDMKLLKPLDSLLTLDCFLGFESGKPGSDEYFVNVAAMGSVKGHPFMMRSKELLVQLYDGKELSNLSGPNLATQLLKDEYGLVKYGQQVVKGNITLFEKDIFYPIPVDKAYLISEDTVYPSKTIGVHVWGRTWFTREMLLEEMDQLRKYTHELKAIVDAYQEQPQQQFSTPVERPTPPAVHIAEGVKETTYYYQEASDFPFDTDGSNIVVLVPTVQEVSRLIDLLMSAEYYMPGYRGEWIIGTADLSTADKELLHRFLGTCSLTVQTTEEPGSDTLDKVLINSSKTWVMVLHHRMVLIGNPLPDLARCIADLNTDFVNLPLVSGNFKTILSFGLNSSGKDQTPSGCIDPKQFTEFVASPLKQPFLSNYLSADAFFANREAMLKQYATIKEEKNISAIAGNLFTEGTKIGNLHSFPLVDLREKSNSVSATAKPKRIALIADIRNWAFHNIARNIQEHLSNEYEFTLFFQEDFGGSRWPELYIKLYKEKFDIIFFFWRDTLNHVFSEG